MNIGDTIRCRDTLDTMKTAGALMSEGYILRIKELNVLEVVDIIETDSEVD